jgi:hypothetical protein
VDEDYTFDRVNPIVGGEYEDLIYLKQMASGGSETADPAGRNLNFLNDSVRYAPLSARLGARLTF